MSAELIRQARDLLMEDGWCKGHLRNDRGERCIEGAMVDAFLRMYESVVLDAQNLENAERDIKQAIADTADHTGFAWTKIWGNKPSIACFNDEPERTFDQG